MAEVVVNYLIERLLEFESESVELIAGVQEYIYNLVADLQGLMAFLKDASLMPRDSSAAGKQTLRDIKTVVYKAEDAIDKFLIEAKQHQDKHVTIRWIDNIPHWINVRNVAKEIQSIRKQVNDVRSKNQALLDANTLGTLSAHSVQPRERTLLDEDDDVVVFDEAAKDVIERLTGGSENLEAVPIVGMAGLGKSTFARKVYKDKKIAYEFFNCLWIGVYRTYIKKDILLKILSNFKNLTNEHKSMTEDQITAAIRTELEKGGRCLIVLDDVWNGDVMDFIQHVFPKNKKGHRIMMTTRQTDTASCFNDNYIHQLHFLNEDDSLLLLKKKVFRRDSCPGEFEEPGRSIAKKCSGLPLAIVVIAGVLAGCNTKRVWQLVNQNIGNLRINRGDPDSCLEFVKKSYDLLSYYQKACFLYCATFPRGFDIPAWKLIRLWIAEGFIPNQNLTLEEQAEYCLNDLTKKNLVMVMKRTSDGQIRSCRLHDMLYEFCKKEASKGDIYQEISRARDQPWAIKVSCRRLCIDSSILYDFFSLSLSNRWLMENIRSFLSFSVKPVDTSASSPVIKHIHKGFPLIKVLDVEPITFIFTKEFYELLHLRYISLSGDFKSLPKLVGNFWNLETLIIHTTNQESDTFEVKADIWSMMRLRHLHTNVPAKLPPPSYSTGRERECYLQTLSTIASASCTKIVFARARNLRKLAIQGQVVALLDNNASGLGELSKLKLLENLKLVNEDQYTGKIVSLPMFIFPKSLRKLTFSGTQLEWGEMTKLGQLDSLEVLKLKNNAFKGDFWEPEIGGFSGLLVLWIGRTDLKTWRASHRNFPSLKRLFLISCENLEAVPEVPESLADIPNLQEMKLEYSQKAVKSARKIAEKLKHRENSSTKFTLSVFPPESETNSKST